MNLNFAITGDGSTLDDPLPPAPENTHTPLLNALSTIRYLYIHNGSYTSSVTYHLSISHTYTIYMHFLKRPLIATAIDRYQQCFHSTCKGPNTHTADLGTLIIGWGSDHTEWTYDSYALSGLGLCCMIGPLCHYLHLVLVS